MKSTEQLRRPDTRRHRMVTLLMAAGLVVALAGPRPVSAQGDEAGEAAGSVLAATAGGLIGVVAGGYGNLAIVVLKARYGHYPHSFGDAFGWESTPILAAGGTGAAIGLLSSDLLIPWVIGGAAGFGLGAGAGYAYGRTVWGDRQSRWANAAVGAAVGMTIGSTVAIIRGLADDGDSPDPGGAAAIRVPLLELRF